jgi:predicted Zn-dependent protease
VLEEREDFQFPRDSATATQIVKINGVPQMDNDQPAPQHTTQTATQKLLDGSRLFRWMQAINTAVNSSTATTELTAFRNQQIADIVGTYYLPAGRDWKTEIVNVLTPMDVLHTVARAAMQKYVRHLAGEAIASDEAFSELAPE